MLGRQRWVGLFSGLTVLRGLAGIAAGWRCPMKTPASDLETLVQEALAAIAMAPPDPPESEVDVTMRERFFEILTLILANLYGKTPVSAPLFDRATFLRVTVGMDDNESGALSKRTEDWIRLEGLARQQDGQKSYSLTRPSLAVVSTITGGGTLGEVMEKLLKHYAVGNPSNNVRRITRLLGSYYITRMARN